MAVESKEPTLEDSIKALETLLDSLHCTNLYMDDLHVILDKSIHGSAPRKDAVKIEAPEPVRNIRFDLNRLIRECITTNESTQKSVESLKQKMRTSK